MAYATCEDIQQRRNLPMNDWERCTALLEDAAVIVDAYNQEASEAAKKLVSCNMVIRVMESEQDNSGNYFGTGIFTELDEFQWKW